MADLSLIVTTYNIENYIRECLESVAAQTHRDLEVLVVDDGSTDSTPQIIAEFAAGDPRFIPVLLEQNTPGGVATAANIGLDRATGEWVGFVDGDDYVEPTMFAEWLGAALDNGTDLAMCQYEEVDSAGERQAPADAQRWAALDRQVYVLDPANRRMFLRFIAVPWRKLYRRSMLEQFRIRYPEGDFFYEDNPFHWFNLLSADSIAVVPKVLCYHRIGRAGQTMATADSRLFKIFQHHEFIRDWLVTHDLVEEYSATLAGWVISQAEWISRRTPLELRQELFDVVSPILSSYPMGVIAQALREGNKGAQAERLSTSLAKGNFRLFNRVLNGRPNTENPLVTGMYHLRYSGVRQTATITRRYIGNRVDGRRMSQILPGDLGGSSHHVTSKDVLFAVVVLQRQLTAVQSELASVRAELAIANAQTEAKDESGLIDEQ